MAPQSFGWLHAAGFVFHVEEVGSRRVRQEVEQTEYPRSNIRTPIVTVQVRPRCQLHNKRNEVQERRNARIYQFRQNPVDWQIQYFPNAEQVHETPQDGGNEWCDHDEQKPVCASD